MLHTPSGSPSWQTPYTKLLPASRDASSRPPSAIAGGSSLALRTCYFMLGAGLLAAWNALITATDYFQAVYPGWHTDRLFTLCYLPLCMLMLLVGLRYPDLPSPPVRIRIGYAGFTAAMAAVPLLDALLMAPSAATPAAPDGGLPDPAASMSTPAEAAPPPPPLGALVAVLACVAVVGMCDGLCQGALFGEAAQLPSPYTHALVSGTASSGLLVCLLRVASKASFEAVAAAQAADRQGQGGQGETAAADAEAQLEGLRNGTRLYFALGGLLSLACLALYDGVLPRLRPSPWGLRRRPQHAAPRGAAAAGAPVPGTSVAAAAAATAEPQPVDGDFEKQPLLLSQPSPPSPSLSTLPPPRLSSPEYTFGACGGIGSCGSRRDSRAGAGDDGRQKGRGGVPRDLAFPAVTLLPALPTSIPVSTCCTVCGDYDDTGSGGRDGGRLLTPETSTTGIPAWRGPATRGSASSPSLHHQQQWWRWRLHPRFWCPWRHRGWEYCQAGSLRGSPQVVRCLVLSWRLCGCLGLTYAVTLSIFPGFLAEDVHSAELGDWYPILLITAYNAADLLGKSLPCLTPEDSGGGGAAEPAAPPPPAPLSSCDTSAEQHGNHHCGQDQRRDTQDLKTQHQHQLQQPEQQERDQVQPQCQQQFLHHRLSRDRDGDTDNPQDSRHDPEMSLLLPTAQPTRVSGSNSNRCSAADAISSDRCRTSDTLAARRVPRRSCLSLLLAPLRRPGGLLAAAVLRGAVALPAFLVAARWGAPAGVMAALTAALGVSNGYLTSQVLTTGPSAVLRGTHGPEPPRAELGQPSSTSPADNITSDSFHAARRGGGVPGAACGAAELELVEVSGRGGASTPLLASERTAGAVPRSSSVPVVGPSLEPEYTVVDNELMDGALEETERGQEQ